MNAAERAAAVLGMEKEVCILTRIWAVFTTSVAWVSLLMSHPNELTKHDANSLRLFDISLMIVELIDIIE